MIHEIAEQREIGDPHTERKERASFGDFAQGIKNDLARCAVSTGICVLVGCMQHKRHPEIKAGERKDAFGIRCDPCEAAARKQPSYRDEAVRFTPSDGEAVRSTSSDGEAVRSTPSDGDLGGCRESVLMPRTAAHVANNPQGKASKSF